MKHDQVQTLNYCAHAIEDLHGIATSWQDMAPKSARVIRRLTDMLEHSVKFILPNCCDLIDPTELRQAHLDLMRLPYPCVAFEIPWKKETEGPSYVGDFQQTPATKRIALCWEPSPEYELLPGLNDVPKLFPEGGVFILPIYWAPEFNKWMVGLGGGFVPYANKLHDMPLDKSMPATNIAYTALIEAGQAPKSHTKQFRSEPFYLLPEFFEKTVSTYGNKEKAFAQIILDSHDETMVLIQACSVINCANVTTADIIAPAALNKKRQANGKQPFFSYKVLQLSDDPRSAGKGVAGGQHASPRMHLRRGHLRRLESKVVWVRPAMINAESKRGIILKDYAVQQKT